VLCEGRKGLTRFGAGWGPEKKEIAMSQNSPSNFLDDRRADRRRNALQAGLVGIVLAFSVLVTAAIAGAFAASPFSSEPEVAELQTPETRRWNATREAIEYEHMYADDVKAPSFDHMYARPRLQRY
jgi:hypothetical protein